jgi:hypothetical protein
MSYRNINIDGRQWKFKIGRSSVHLRDPDGKGQVIPKIEITRYRQSPRTQINIDLQVHRDDPKSFLDAISRCSDALAIIEEETTLGPRDIRHWIENRRTTTSIYRN